jgi:hypothetical protein
VSVVTLRPQLGRGPAETSGHYRSPAVSKSPGDNPLYRFAAALELTGLSLIRMRSQVQVLAGPPPIVAGQSAAGSERSQLAAGLGRAGAARPSPPARPGGPSGSAHPGVRLGDDHAPWSRTPAEDSSHAAGTATSRCSLLPCPQRSRPRGALRSPAWPAWSLSGQARPPRPAPNPAARVRHRPPIDQRDFGSVARVPASSTVDRAVDGSAATGVSTRSCGHGRPATSTWVPNATRLRWEKTDASGWTGQTPDGWTPHGWTADGWTPHGWTADDWTLDGWTADGRPPDSLDDDPR